MRKEFYYSLSIAEEVGIEEEHWFAHRQKMAAYIEL